MKKQYLLGVSVVALGLAMTPAFADVDAELEDSLNGNGAGNDTQTDITGDASNTPQTGDENVRGDIGSGNEFDISYEDDRDGNGIGNDTFQNDGKADNAPQTGDYNVRGDVASGNSIDDHSSDVEDSAISEGNAAADDGNIENVSATGEGIAINEAGGGEEHLSVLRDGERGSGGINIAGGDIAGESIDENTASENGVIFNDVGGEEGDGLNMAAGDVAEGEGSDIKKTQTASGVAYADRDSAAVVVGTVDVLFDTDAVASNTEMEAANVLNIASANVAIGTEDSDVKMSASADIGGAADSVSLGQFSANAGSQGVTEQSQTVTANIGSSTF